MVLVICGNFEPKEILQEVKNRLVEKQIQGEIKRIYPKSDEAINKKYKESNMEVSKPIYMIGIKDKIISEDIVKRHIAIEILLNMLVGKSSKLYQKLYNKGIILSTPDTDYEFTENYAHILISGQSKDPEQVKQELILNIKELKNEINEEDFIRIKKKVYGDYVIEYNNISDISKMFLADYFKKINSFDYIEKYNCVTMEYAKEILEEIFDEKNMIMSVIKEK